MLYAFWAFAFTLCLLYSLSKKSKLFRYITVGIVFLFMFILLGWSRGGNDIEIGIRRYNNYQLFQSFTEYGYNILITWAHTIGLDYRQFFVISALIELLVIFWFVERNAAKSPIVYGLFMVWPMVSFFQYSRSIAAFTFILIGIDVLLNKPKGYIIKYVILVLLASSIHFSSLFFLLYLAADVLERKPIYIISGVGFILLYLATGINLVSNFILRFVGEQRSVIVMASTSAEGMVGRVFGIALYIFQFFAMYFYLKRLLHVDMDNSRDEFFYKINVMSLFFVPLTLNYGLGFARFPNLLSIINYCYYVNKISTVKNQKKRIQSYLLLGVFIVALLYINIRNVEYWNAVVAPLFEMNELIK